MNIPDRILTLYLLPYLLAVSISAISLYGSGMAIAALTFASKASVFVTVLSISLIWRTPDGSG